MDKEQQVRALAYRWVCEFCAPNEEDWKRMLKAVAQHDLGTLYADLDRKVAHRG